MIILNEKTPKKHLGYILAEEEKVVGTLEIKTTDELIAFLRRHIDAQPDGKFFLLFETAETKALMEMSCQDSNPIELTKKDSGEVDVFLGETRRNFVRYLNAVLLVAFLWAEDFRRKALFCAGIMVNDMIEYNAAANGDEKIGYVEIGFVPNKIKDMPNFALSYVGVTRFEDEY